MSATCTGQPTAHEALLSLQGSSSIVLADVTDATHPQKLCTLIGSWSPELVTQRMISWAATQIPGQAGPSVLATMDLFAGTTVVIAKWNGGLFLDGLHAWSPDESSIAYVTSDAGAVNLHLQSGGGDRVVAAFGAVPGRGVSAAEDDAYIGFSADGMYLAFVQTFAPGGAQLQVRKTADGTIAYSQATGTMATWASTGASLYFREPLQSTIRAWTPSGGATQLFGLQQSWLHPTPDPGDDTIAYTVRDNAGLPHVWVYGHNGRQGGQLGNVRSSPIFLNTTSLFLEEEKSCSPNCGPGPPTVPDGNTFVYNLGTQAETPSTITSVLASWPRIGQV